MHNQQLNHLMGAYFNQDYYLSGETIEEVMQTYLDCEASDTIQALIEECAEFVKKVDAENVFYELYRYDFKPERWGLTSVAFLKLISGLASAFLSKGGINQ
ncbi:hypothetical protein PMPD1_1301 [Paramixta manurensis]|uniref:CdiI immunity protein domain-containing protein n=1 Tax=Paramixta manurensis TaxID=2740817 RepID=A0A6M8UHH8_9GAMM|nr:hypothetical protein PMPD1_1301 [Erwiniaceae bacterium PD-1]